MRFPLLACVALVTTTLSPVHSLEFEAGAPPSLESEATDGGGGRGIFQYVFDTVSHVAGGIHDKGEWLSQSSDAFIRHATELYPSEKVHEFKTSVEGVVNTATTLHQMALATAEQHGMSPDSVKEELGVIFNAIFEKLKEQFPSPAEALGHENRTATVNAVLDLIDESFSQFAVKLGVSEESLKIYSDPLKSHAQTIIVTIGDLVEQHPRLALSLLLIPMAKMGVFESLLSQVLNILGFSSLGPVKGSLAAWTQRWLFPTAIPKGSWFAALQQLAMTP